MKGNALWIAAFAGLALVGCNKAESLAQVHHDVTEARAEAQRVVADAPPDAQKDSAEAQVAATHKVAAQKCAAMSGEAQKDYKDRANCELDAARRAAEQRGDGMG